MTTIHVTASRDYDVLVQPGLLDDAGALVPEDDGIGNDAVVPGDIQKRRGLLHSARYRFLDQQVNPLSGQTAGHVKMSNGRHDNADRFGALFADETFHVGIGRHAILRSNLLCG